MLWQLQLSLVITFTFDIITCDICLCTEDKLVCDQTHQISSIPRLEPGWAREITQILIIGQPQITRLVQEDLMPYVNLTKLQIERTGLKYISPNAFMFNPKLTQIHLRRNNLNWLSWKIFDHFQISELLLQDNPLTCNCSVLWLQTLPHNITCVDGPFTSPRSIRALRITGCELPQLTIEPPNAVIELGGGVNFTCSSKNLFSTHLTWNKTSLGLNETHARMNSSLLLTIHKAASPGQTLVQCSAENEIGRSNVHAVLEITARPKIVRLYSHLSFYWSICYSITGYPNANLSWKLNDTDLDAFEHNILNVVDTSTAGSLNGCLQLPGTSLDLHGKYTLTASNTISSTTRSILFNPGVAPVSKSKPSRFRPNTSSKFPLFSLILYVLGVAILILILIIGLLAFLRHRRHQKRRLNILQFSHLLDNPTYARQSDLVTVQGHYQKVGTASQTQVANS